MQLREDETLTINPSLENEKMQLLDRLGTDFETSLPSIQACCDDNESHGPNTPELANIFNTSIYTVRTAMKICRRYIPDFHIENNQPWSQIELQTIATILIYYRDIDNDAIREFIPDNFPYECVTNRFPIKLVAQKANIHISTLRHLIKILLTKDEWNNLPKTKSPRGIYTEILIPADLTAILLAEIAKAVDIEEYPKRYIQRRKDMIRAAVPPSINHRFEAWFESWIKTYIEQDVGIGKKQWEPEANEIEVLRELAHIAHEISNKFSVSIQNPDNIPSNVSTQLKMLLGIQQLEKNDRMILLWTVFCSNVLSTMAPSVDTREIYDLLVSTGKLARDTLIQSYWTLVVKYASKYNHNANGDDLIQSGLIGLIDAINGFDPRLGYEFSTYAVPAVKRAVHRGYCELSDTMPKNGPPYNIVMMELDAPISQQQEEGGTLLSLIASKRETVDEAITDIFWKELIQLATELFDLKTPNGTKYQELIIPVIIEHIALGGELTYIADKYGVSVELVRQVRDYVVDTLKTDPRFHDLCIF